MNRVYAREIVYQLIFSYIFTQEVDNYQLNYINKNTEIDMKDIEYIKRTYNNLIVNYVAISDIIAKYSVGFRIDRIYKADLAVLMLATAEMCYDESIPLKVSIKESVDIIKKYSSDKSYRFVNGILASIYREITGEILHNNVVLNEKSEDSAGVAKTIVNTNVSKDAMTVIDE